jgi:hypothetical protein
MCEQNSTEIPTAMTRLTRDTAFNWMFHQYIRPPMLTKTIKITTSIIREELENEEKILFAKK